MGNQALQQQTLRFVHPKTGQPQNVYDSLCKDPAALGTSYASLDQLIIDVNQSLTKAMNTDVNSQE